MKLVAWMSITMVLSLFLFTRALQSSSPKVQAEKRLFGMVVGLTSLFVSIFFVLLWMMEHPIE